MLLPSAVRPTDSVRRCTVERLPDSAAQHRDELLTVYIRAQSETSTGHELPTEMGQRH